MSIGDENNSGSHALGKVYLLANPGLGQTSKDDFRRYDSTFSDFTAMAEALPCIV